MSIPQRFLGGTAKNTSVGAIGHGLMFLTSRSEPTPDEEAFQSMKAAVDAGATFWNTASFYGHPDDRLANLKLLRRFFDRYPEYAEPGKIFLSVKGGISMSPGNPVTQTEDELRKDLEQIINALGPKKKIDLFQLARQISPVEETTPILVKFIQEGLFSHIGLSEVSADTLRRAHAIYPVTAVEIECSLWALEDELYKVIKACEELNVAIAAYSPLGRGLAIGRKPPNDSMIEHMPKFSDENFPNNLKLTHALDKIAARRSIPTTQLALAYVLQLSDKMIPIPGSSSIKRTLENIGAANVKLSPEELQEINKVQVEFPTMGARYGGPFAHLVWV